jgi:protein gp37
MMQRTKIPWATHTWNPTTGCSRECEYCYAKRLTERYPKAFPNKFLPTFYPERLEEPKRKTKPCVIFTCSMGDIFDAGITDTQRGKIFQAMQEEGAGKHIYMLLTKQAARMKKYFEKHRWHKNVWLGVTVTRQSDTCRLENLKALKAGYSEGHKIYASVEPMLELIREDWSDIDLVIAGSKTPGHPLHEAHPDWLDALITDCKKNQTSLHYKHGRDNPEHKGEIYNWRPRL